MTVIREFSRTRIDRFTVRPQEQIVVPNWCKHHAISVIAHARVYQHFSERMVR